MGVKFALTKEDLKDIIHAVEMHCEEWGGG